MNILFIEAFYSGSHKTWLDSLIKHSSHHINKLTLEGKFWKWRMYGGAYSLYDMFAAYIEQCSQDEYPDIVLTSDMLDLSLFISLSRHLLAKIGQPKIGLYFHENQFAYPWQDTSEDLAKGRDVHYGMINYKSALCADFIMFNSNYNKTSFYSGLEKVLNKMPDYPHKTLQPLQAKSLIMPIAIHEPKPMSLDEKNSFYANYPDLDHTLPLILWNHRLEHDKNPKAFFDVLIKLKSNGFKFQLAVLGEMTTKTKNAYHQVFNQLSPEIVALGYLPYKDYIGFLSHSDLLPVTSRHDFFGISIMEALAYGARPLLPKRLAYPDLYRLKDYPELFYDNEKELYNSLALLLTNNKTQNCSTYSHLSQQFLWKNIIESFDSLMLSYITT